MNAMRTAASLEAYPQLLHFIVEQARQHAVPDAFFLRLELACEELLINIVNHAYPDVEGEVEVVCFVQEDEQGKSFNVRIRDWGAPFNPLEKKTSAVSDLDDSQIGGLGILLVKQMTDSVYYTRDNGSNVVTITFYLAE
nr:ATP-binding protein [uncultured Desulfuromonas sp.]